jgi:GTPase SAR1 family protein
MEKRLMRDGANRPPPADPTRAGVVRIVIFGPPQAGKTSLLGALARISANRQEFPYGILLDRSQRLAALAEQVYAGSPKETLEEIVGYPVAWQAAGSRQPTEALLIDCDGRIANTLLAQPGWLTDDNPKGELAREVIQADALLLAIDCAAPAAHVDAQFIELRSFLVALEDYRGCRTEIADLPVFLVLTKCDLLARPDDDAGQWLERLETRKHDVAQRFHAFFDEHTRKESAFGRINLGFWATAVRQPELVGMPARSQEPFGVGELFGRVFGQAHHFRRRQIRSQRRLVGVTLGVAASLVSMVALMIALATVLGPPTAAALAARLHEYRSHEGATAALRLREPLQDKLVELRLFRNDLQFHQLPLPDQDYVTVRLKELTAYRDFKRRLEQVQPAEVRTNKELDALETRLQDGDLSPPPEFLTQWGETEAGLLRSRLVADIEGVLKAAEYAVAWFRKQNNELEWLRTFASKKPADSAGWFEWREQVEIALKRQYPHDQAEPVGTGNPFGYSLVLQMPAVAQAQRDWQESKGALKRLADWCAALGLLGPLPDGARQPLDIPASFAVERAGAHLESLKHHYADLFDASAPIPETAREMIGSAARKSYDNLIEAGQAVVLHHLQLSDGKETPEAWNSVRKWLSHPVKLSEWRVLATMLERVFRPQGEDPVTALASYLAKDRFEISLKRLELIVPANRKLRPAGPLTIHAGDQANPSVLVFARSSDVGIGNQGIINYSFQLPKGETLVYHPGDTFYAALPVEQEGQGSDWMLTWARSRSQVYAMERLLRPPRLHRKDEQNTQGELLEDVAITPFPNTFPREPDLLPIVKPPGPK